MSVPDNLSPRDFLRTSEFSSDRANRRFPNAQDTMLGGLFISHSGEDSVRIQEQIISPVVFERLPADGYFMHSRRSGGAESYKLLVQAALHWCDKFMVVISERSVSNSWVVAEVEWAADNSRPSLPPASIAMDGRISWMQLGPVNLSHPNRFLIFGSM